MIEIVKLLDDYLPEDKRLAFKSLVTLEEFTALCRKHDIHIPSAKNILIYGSRKFTSKYIEIYQDVLKHSKQNLKRFDKAIN